MSGLRAVVDSISFGAKKQYIITMIQDSLTVNRNIDHSSHCITSQDVRIISSCINEGRTNILSNIR